MTFPSPLSFLPPKLTAALRLTPSWHRRIRWGLLTVGLAWLLGWLVLPLWLRPTVERLGSEALGRKVEVGALRFHPWSLGLELDGLSIATADGQSTQLSVQEGCSGWHQLVLSSPRSFHRASKLRVRDHGLGRGG